MTASSRWMEQIGTSSGGAKYLISGRKSGVRSEKDHPPEGRKRSSLGLRGRVQGAK
jgi:hypothetical protein